MVCQGGCGNSEITITCELCGKSFSDENEFVVVVNGIEKKYCEKCWIEEACGEQE